MTVIPAVVEVGQVAQGLADERWQDLNWHQQTVARIKMAMAGSNLALHARIFHHPPKASSLAHLDLYVSPLDSKTILQLGFWPGGSGTDRAPVVLLSRNGEPQPASHFAWQMTPNSEGFEILALIPQGLLGINSDTQIFLVECTASTAAPDFGSRAASLFGSKRASQDNSQFIKVIPLVIG